MFLKLDGRVENKNNRDYLEKVHSSILERLRYLDSAPSVQMQEIPPDIAKYMDAAELSLDENDELKYGQTDAADIRHPDRHASNNEFFDDEVDQDSLALEQVETVETTD